jgi:hypothetical protein
VLADKPVKYPMKEPIPAPLEYVEFAVVGELVLDDQHIPLIVTLAQLSLVTFPPDVEVVCVIAVAVAEAASVGAIADVAIKLVYEPYP